MALPEPTKPKQGSNSHANSGEQEDKDFDPSAEALIGEIDDERTLEEEEALANNNGGAQVQEELDELKRESEMPIEELLAYYQRMRQQGAGDEEFDEDYEDDDEFDDDEEEDDDDEEDNEDEDRENGRNNEPHDRGSHGGAANTNKNTGLPPRQGGDNHNSGPDTTQNANSTDQTHHGSKAQDATSSTQELRIVEGGDTARHSSLASCEYLRTNQTPGISQEVELEPRQRRPITDFNPGEDVDMFQTLLRYDLDDSDDLDADYSCSDYGDDERDWRRSIHVGPEYQADIPDGLSEYGDLPPYETEDKLVWRWNSELTGDQVVEFLKKGSLISKRTDICISSASVPKISNESMRIYRERMQDINLAAASDISDNNRENVNGNLIETMTDLYMSQSRKRARIDQGIQQENAFDGINLYPNPEQTTAHGGDISDTNSQDVRPDVSIEEYFQDEEQLLYLLLQCNYNFEEALRRRKLDPLKYYLYEPMSLWSQDECLSFEQGLRSFGKDFLMIRDNKVQTRSRAEVVSFYYLWKKSERHDVYTNQYKLDRKRCLSHPGTTDYMDKFIEDHESNLNATSSSTPTPSESSIGVAQMPNTTSHINQTVPLCHSNEENVLSASVFYPAQLPQMATELQQQPVHHTINMPQDSPITNHQLDRE